MYFDLNCYLVLTDIHTYQNETNPQDNFDTIDHITNYYDINKTFTSIDDSEEFNEDINEN